MASGSPYTRNLPSWWMILSTTPPSWCDGHPQHTWPKSMLWSMWYRSDLWRASASSPWWPEHLPQPFLDLYLLHPTEKKEARRKALLVNTHRIQNQARKWNRQDGNSPCTSDCSACCSSPSNKLRKERSYCSPDWQANGVEESPSCQTPSRGVADYQVPIIPQPHGPHGLVGNSSSTLNHRYLRRNIKNASIYPNRPARVQPWARSQEHESFFFQRTKTSDVINFKKLSSRKMITGKNSTQTSYKSTKLSAKI
jgi:hypothetical protein